MKDNKKNNELQSRREFFRRVSTKTLPILGAVVLGPAISLTTLTSCGCDGCKEECMDNCEGGCVTSCQGIAKSDSCSNCASSCSGSSTNASCSSCANSCSDTCKDTCSNSATGAEPQDEVSPASGKVGGYEYVDLGLSVKWARYNYGANKPEDYGKLVADLDASGSGERCYYYAFTAPEIEGGDSICGNVKYDVATSQWSRNWCLPSKKNLDELLENTSYEYISLNGVKGVKFVSKKNGNSIFLPYAGFQGYSAQEINNNDGVGRRGHYWTGDIKELVYWTNSTPRNLAGFCKYLFNIDENIYGIKVMTERGHALASVRPVTTSSGSGGGGCTGSSCSSNCANNSASSSCSSCATSCTSSCKTQCDYNCAATCKSHCGGSCNTSCGGTCTYVSAGSGCSGCARNCYNQCYTSCDYACSNNCESSCVHGSK